MIRYDDEIRRQTIRECLEVVRIIGESGGIAASTREAAYKECAQLTEVGVNRRFQDILNPKPVTDTEMLDWVIEALRFGGREDIQEHMQESAARKRREAENIKQANLAKEQAK